MTLIGRATGSWWIVCGCGRALLDAGPYYEKAESELLAAWAAEEMDGEMLAKVLHTFTEPDHPDQETIGLRHAGHHDPRILREVPHTLSTNRVPGAPRSQGRPPCSPSCATRTPRCGSGRARRACATGTCSRKSPGHCCRWPRAPDAALRGAAAAALVNSQDRTLAVADVLAALLGEENQLVRLNAANDFALRDDPRTADAIERVGRLGDGFEYEHRADELRRWSWRKENSADE
ncbi:hypothetical protein AV521_32675 [Streptomyces sp. IMTB 2501]|uniref:hypothetical protein n=1 Tax=Streptomyces sp. IMTB 2501 TaxID=1776340 RepID=UPI00096F9631|nr:hypothetical protein [Streptomyces sp. IMTB 2501]OLZ65420.1 hypothetical protein AV521_32675 [Streptomyces sp. IMTB 2501]